MRGLVSRVAVDSLCFLALVDWSEGWKKVIRVLSFIIIMSAIRGQRVHPMPGRQTYFDIFSKSQRVAGC